MRMNHNSSTSNSNNNDLPEGWNRACLPDIANINMGQSPPGSTYNEIGEGLPFFQGKADFGPRFPTVRVWCTEPKKLADEGDVLISIRAPVGPTNVANCQCVIGRGLAGLKPLGEIPTELLLHALRLQEPELSKTGTGSTFTAINKKDLEQIEINIPPLAEQKRIVAKVEELLGHVNAARGRLSKVPALLKRFRQAVLANACAGKLTEDWRENNQNIESVGVLYERINQRRQKEYEAVCRKAKKNKKRPPREPVYLKEYVADDDSLPDIPEEWNWSKVCYLGLYGDEAVKTGPFGAILKSREFVSEGVPIIAVGNVQWGYFDLEGARVDHVTEEKAEELSSYLVRTGDVLFTRSGSIGRSMVVPNIADGWLMSYHLLRVRADQNLINPEYLYFVFSGCEASKEYIAESIVGTTRPGFNTKILENLPVPLPPLEEQKEIVRRVEELFKWADAIEKRLAAATRRAEKLTQSILAKAFRGELVPTEADLARIENRSYEPASELLNRIQSERKKEKLPSKSNKSKKRKKSS